MRIEGQQRSVSSSQGRSERCSICTPSTSTGRNQSADVRNVIRDGSIGSRDGNKVTESPRARASGDHVTDQLLVQAEHFHARVEAPKGMSSTVNQQEHRSARYSDILMPYDYEKLCNKFVHDDGLAPIDSEILFLWNFDQDDEFFHVTSQIEPSLRIKIERGEFVDLERLLPRERGGPKSGAGGIQ